MTWSPAYEAACRRMADERDERARTFWREVAHLLSLDTDNANAKGKANAAQSDSR